MKEIIIKYGVEIVLAAVVGYLTAKVKTIKTKYDSIQTGMLSLLRAELIRGGEKYTKQGYVPVYAKDAYDKAYIAYHGLGGNGTMTELHTKVMQLPTVNPTKEE